jgi:membrane fusion protein, heavy metal efflux system
MQSEITGGSTSASSHGTQAAHGTQAPGSKSLGPKLKAALFTAAPLVVLVSLAVWGHLNHWSFHHADDAKAHAAAPIQQVSNRPESPPEGVDAEPAAPINGKDTGGLKVKFHAPKDVHASGVETTIVMRQPLKQEISANGIINYNQTLVAQLSARVAGTVWRIEKQLGQSFRKGDVLAIIEAVEVGRSKADFLQSLVLFRLKKEIADQLKLRESVIPYRQLMEAQAEVREAQIRLTNAQQTLVNLGLPVKVEDLANVADDELSRRVQFLGLPESITKSLDPATTTASLAPLLAPFDGVVIGHDVSLGEMVSPEAPRFTVADTSRMWIQLDVRREDASQMRLGQPITFISDAGATEINSKIAWISTEVDEKTRTVQVRADVLNPIVDHVEAADDQEQRLLRANAFGTGRIRVRETASATVIPHEAMQWETTHPVVFVQLNETTFESRPVEIGISLAEGVEITAGLEPGERIATSGSHLLKAEMIRSRMVSSTN